MNNNYKVIDTANWVRKGNYEWFKDFTNPTFSFNVKVDVTSVVNFSKKTNTSFFVNFLYVITRVNNEIEALRLRLVDGKVLLYDKINPTFVIKTIDGCFNNGESIYYKEYEKFYNEVKAEVNKQNGYTNKDKVYNEPYYDVFYSSCLTTISIEGMTHPLNSNDRNSINVPRIFWDKYRLEDGKYILLLNMTVSHALIDGEELVKAFNVIKEYCLDFEKIIK